MLAIKNGVDSGDATVADTSLLLLLDEVRGKTLRVLKAVPSESTRWAPPGLQNTILWHAGHALVVVEWPRVF